MMSAALIFDADTLLCRQTETGWQPVTATLPASMQACGYEQLGCVLLSADNLVNPPDDTTHQAQTLTADAAISHAFATAHALLPAAIMPADDAQNIGDCAFIAYRQLISQLSAVDVGRLNQALQLLRWQAETQFCSRCGHGVHAHPAGERAMVCDRCNLHQYPRIQPCVITAITRPNPDTGAMQILLAHHRRYGQSTQPKRYGLIAGFVEVGESLEQAVVREVGEEVAIEVTNIRYVSSQPWPFPSNLMLGFRATYARGDIVIEEEELTEAKFFDVADMPLIPPIGSIARDLIEQVAAEQGIDLRHHP
ncbi:NAD(+) diphosphatase [Psychrobacter aestuarii]|uniref:NAD(+) diphosphatase n=1 Tax=Psychrobacter aestuarii TaxID=556327 RepID=A0ABP3FEW7_9GAMM|nr:NAD(+) diphosphatase [Psychrobacter aestuarii]